MMADQHEIRIAVLEQKHRDHIRQCEERWAQVLDALKSIRVFIAGALVSALMASIGLITNAVSALL